MALRLAVLLSGRGSNYAAIDAAISEGTLDAEIVGVISNRSDAPGLQLAAGRGQPSWSFSHRDYATREEHEARITAVLESIRPDYICLAGYMRRLSPSFVGRWSMRLLNIHPSLLPAFPGIDAQRQALEYGVRYTGCTVHFVDEGVDTGPILVQRVVPVLANDDVATLSARLLIEEHKAYPEALRLLARGRFRVEGRRVIFL